MAKGAERGFLFASALAVATGSGSASAQSGSAAEVLFEEGRRLMDAGDYAAACPKLAESERLDPAGGTLMNLAACHERAGRTATAWAEFNDALAAAKRDGRQDRVLEASRKVALLAPKLSRVVVAMATPTDPALEVFLDGTPLASASWGVLLPVDPGEHEVSARAPGRVSFRDRATIDAGITRPFVVPQLARVPDEASAPPPRTAPMTGSRVAAFAIGGLGVAALGVGTGYGIVAADKKKESEAHCSSNGQTCDPTGAQLLRSASSAAWTSDIGVGLGVAGLAMASYLFLAKSHEPPTARASTLRVLPVVGPSSLSMSVGGTF